MKKDEVLANLGFVKTAKEQHALDEAKFQSDVWAVMRRLLHEAAANHMSVEMVAKSSGHTVKRIRQMMRDVGLNPASGRNLLSAKAAEALATNADLLGIEPSEMDLMSPLAYLPMGEQLRRRLQDSTVSRVTDVDEDYESTAEAIHDLHLRDGHLRYPCPTCGKEPVEDVHLHTCPECRSVFGEDGEVSGNTEERLRAAFAAPEGWVVAREAVDGLAAHMLTYLGADQ